MPFDIPYEAVLAVHLGSFLVNVLLVIAADTHGALWVLGRLSTLPRQRLVVLHRLVWVGLSASIVSGALLFSTASDYLLTVPAFYTKLALVAALVVNSFIIGRHLTVATSRTFASLSSGERWPLFVSAFISTASWVGVVVAAQFLGL